jgi:hypothetical protein
MCRGSIGKIETRLAVSSRAYARMQVTEGGPEGGALIFLEVTQFAVLLLFRRNSGYVATFTNKDIPEVAQECLGFFVIMKKIVSACHPSNNQVSDEDEQQQ